MGEALYCLALLACIGTSLVYFVPRHDRRFALVTLICLLPIHVFVLYTFNESIPFVPSEKDASLYARYSERTFTNVTDVADISVTASSVGGAVGNLGYVHLLTIVQQFVGDGDGLFYKKALNISALWVLSFAWYAIGLMLGGRALARSITIACACLPTLWYFYCVLLRDLLTAALHSVVLASVMLFYLGSKRKPVHLSVLILTIVGSVFLRPVTLFINAGIVLMVAFVIKGKGLSNRGHSWRARRSWQVGGLILSCVVVLWLMGNESLSDALNWRQKMNISELRTEVDAASDRSGASISSPVGILLSSAKAAPLFFASEPTIASKAVDLGDPEQLRGLMNGVWFVLLTPFAVLGVVMAGRSTVMNLRAMSSGRQRNLERESGSISIGRPESGSKAALLIVLLYCGIWFAVCVVWWDWTRWRLPVVPALCLIAIWAFKRIGVGERFLSFGVWILAVCVWRIVA